MSWCNTSGGDSSAWSKRPTYAQNVKNTSGYSLLAGNNVATATSTYYITSSAQAYNSIYSGSTVQAPALLNVFIMKIS